MANVNSFVLLVWLLLPESNTGYHPNLKYYTTIHKSSLRWRVKREVYSHVNEYQEVKVQGFGREFHLDLQKSDLLSADFSTDIISIGGSIKTLPLNHTHFYHGKIKDEINSSCTVSVENGLLLATITTISEEYIIEPAWRHFPDMKDSMIFYRTSDVRTPNNGYKICHTPYGNTTNWHLSGANLDDHGYTSRQKRQSVESVEKTCRLLLVVDRLFYKGIGGGTYFSTLSYLFGVIGKVNQIYRSTAWGSDITSFGFQIAKFVIHEDFNSEDGHYNSKDRKMSSEQLLQAFSQTFYQNSYCIVHLFTYESFDALGLAYVAYSRPGTIGGICDSSVYRYKQAFNTGWTTFMDSRGNRQLAVVSMGTVAHEFAHSMGSPHDPDTEECMPSQGGRYIMYEHSLSGYLPNHFKFSPCTRRAIYSVMKAKGSNCLIDGSQSLTFCGNGRLETGEQCDAGETPDSCCDNKCMFKVGADCSSKNYACCTNCSLARAGTQCYLAADDNTECKKQAFCNGYEYSCPTPSHKPNGTKCTDSGRCYNGQCVNFCRLEGQIPCICSDSQNSCRRCCKRSPNGTCTPYGTEHIQNGRPCYQGYCSEGTCIKTVAGIAKLWKAIEDLFVNDIEKSMKNNIVFLVPFFVLCVYLPVSIVICCKEGECACPSDPDDVNDQASNNAIVNETSMEISTFSGITEARPSMLSSDNTHNNQPSLSHTAQNSSQSLKYTESGPSSYCINPSFKEGLYVDVNSHNTTRRSPRNTYINYGYDVSSQELTKGQLNPPQYGSKAENDNKNNRYYKEFDDRPVYSIGVAEGENDGFYRCDIPTSEFVHKPSTLPHKDNTADNDSTRYRHNDYSSGFQDRRSYLLHYGNTVGNDRTRYRHNDYNSGFQDRRSYSPYNEDSQNDVTLLPHNDKIRNHKTRLKCDGKAQDDDIHFMYDNSPSEFNDRESNFPTLSKTTDDTGSYRHDTRSSQYSDQISYLPRHGNMTIDQMYIQPINDRRNFSSLSNIERDSEEESYHGSYLSPDSYNHGGILHMASQDNHRSVDGNHDNQGPHPNVSQGDYYDISKC